MLVEQCTICMIKLRTKILLTLYIIISYIILPQCNLFTCCFLGFEENTIQNVVHQKRDDEFLTDAARLSALSAICAYRHHAAVSVHTVRPA